MVGASTEEKEYAACVFIKWLTAAEQNMKFVDETGYLPVTKQAFEEEMPGHLNSIADARVRKMLTSVLSMYESYTFFTAPNYGNFDSDSDGFETKFKRILSDHREAFLAGEAVSPEEALQELKK